MKTDHGSELTGSEMASMLDEFCNAANQKARAEFVEQLVSRTHRTLQQSVMRLFVSCIERWAEQTNYDARNEATIKLCKRIIASCGDKYDRHLPTV